MYKSLLSTIVGSGQTNLSQLYFSRLSLAMPAKLNFSKTPASVRLVSSRTVSTSTGISGCYEPHRQTAMPGQKSIYETFLVGADLTVQKTTSWATSRNEDMVWYRYRSCNWKRHMQRFLAVLQFGSNKHPLSPSAILTPFSLSFFSVCSRCQREGWREGVGLNQKRRQQKEWPSFQYIPFYEQAPPATQTKKTKSER